MLKDKSHRTLQNCTVFLLVLMVLILVSMPVSIAFAQENTSASYSAECLDYSKGYETFNYEKTVTQNYDGKYFVMDFYRGSQYRLFLKSLTSQVYWAGSASQSPSMTVSWTTTTSVAETNSYSLSVKLGLQVDAVWAKLSGSIENTVTNSVTYSSSEASQYAVVLDRTSSAGYYALTSAVNAYKYEIRIRAYSDATKNHLTDDYGYNYAYIYSSSLPYVYLRYKTTAMTNNDFFFAS